MALAFPEAGPSGDGRVDVILMTEGWRRWLRIRARIEFRTSRRAHRSRIHIQWHARRHEHIFPTIKADIMTRPTASTGSELRLIGEYRPPLGLIGFLADRLFGGRAARSNAQAFLEDLAGAVASDPGRPQQFEPTERLTASSWFWK